MLKRFENKTRILVCAEPYVARKIEQDCIKQGCTVWITSDEEGVMNALKKHLPEVVILDPEIISPDRWLIVMRNSKIKGGVLVEFIGADRI